MQKKNWLLLGKSAVDPDRVSAITKIAGGKDNLQVHLVVEGADVVAHTVSAAEVAQLCVAVGLDSGELLARNEVKPVKIDANLLRQLNT